MDPQVKGYSEKLRLLSAFWCNGMDPLSLGYSSRLHQNHSKISTFQDTLSLGYPSRYTKTTQKSQLFRIPSHLWIHLVTPKPLKNLNFSGYPLTWVSISLHQNHSKISTFQDTLSHRYPSGYTKSTQKSQLFRIRSHLGIHLVTPKPLKNLNFSEYPLTWVSISLHQNHSKISTCEDPLSLGYPSRYTKSTHNLNFSGYPL